MTFGGEVVWASLAPAIVTLTITDAAILLDTGAAVTTLGGCCGLAGSWGFEEDKYDLSMKIGERRLLPAARDADNDTMIVADGFSCKTQIVQGTDRRALHTAQVIKMALDYGTGGTPESELPESDYPDVVLEGSRRGPKTAAAAGAALVGAAALAWAMRKREVR